jgi:hypothetical protein
LRKLICIAIAYDFDGTLAPGNMQEHSFLPIIEIPAEKFWSESNLLAEKHQADNVLTYMNLMLKKAKEKDVPIRKQDFKNHGKSVVLFDGLDSWFNRVNDHGKKLGLRVEHYVISSGLREIIEGTSISHEFKMIYASSYKYDANDVAEWPALAINFTTKTQYLFRINKGVLDVCDNKKINEFVKMEDRPIPFKRMIFIGDGETDIPCFSLVKSLGGHSIAVYKPKTPGTKGKAEKLIEDGRVNFITPADYTKGSNIENIVKAVMNKIASDCSLDFHGKHE